MEGLRVSKLEEGQQWGKNTSSKDKVQWGRRPPFIGGEKSNRYAHSPHRAVLPLMGVVLPLGVAVLLLRVAVLLLASGTKKLHPLQFAVVPLQPFQNTKTAITSAYELRFARVICQIVRLVMLYILFNCTMFIRGHLA